MTVAREDFGPCMSFRARRAPRQSRSDWFACPAGFGTIYCRVLDRSEVADRRYSARLTRDTVRRFETIVLIIIQDAIPGLFIVALVVKIFLIALSRFVVPIGRAGLS